MADGQHSRRDGGVPAAGTGTARRASLEVTRRTLLGAVCALPVLSEVGRRRPQVNDRFFPVIPGLIRDP